MSEHSVVEAKNQLSSLIDRAMAGESVVITRHGSPVVELRPLRRAARALTAEELAQFDAKRVYPDPPLVDETHYVQRMRSESNDRLLRR